MQSKAKICSALVDLSGPAFPGVTLHDMGVARGVLSWVLGQHGDKSLAEAAFDIVPAAPKVVVAPPPPAAPPSA
jgi:hypothetical protein